MSQHDVADRLEPQFRAAWRRVTDGLDMSGVYNAWRVGAIGRIWSSVPWATFLLDLTRELETVMVRGLSLAAESALRDVPTSQVRKIGEDVAAALGFSFNETNPRAVEWARQNAAVLASAIVDGSQEAIREIIVRMFRDGVPPRSAARLLRRYIALNRRNALALDNFRRLVEDQNELRRLAREAESALSAQQRAHYLRRAVLSRERVDQLVIRYSERLHRRQAETLARTEAMRVANEGQAELWYQAQEQGLLEADRTRRKWVLTQDERLCPICAPIPSLRGNVVGLDEPFRRADGGTIMRPPAHPNCRCTVVLVFANEDGTFRGPDELPRGWAWADGRPVRTGKGPPRRSLKPTIPRR